VIEPAGGRSFPGRGALTYRKRLLLAAAPALLAILAASGARAEPRRGPYFGEPPPDREPRVFARGFVSKPGRMERTIAFSPDGTEAFFVVTTPDYRPTLLHTRQVGGLWTPSEVAPFAHEGNNTEPAFSPDGRRLYFASNRPPGAPPYQSDLWVVERDRDGWGEPKHLSAPLSSPESDYHPTVSVSGTLCFASTRNGNPDLFCARWEHDHFASPQPVAALNTEHQEWDPFLAPDESYMVFKSDRPGGLGGMDGYIAFRRAGGGWGPPRLIPPPISTPGGDDVGDISPDGRFLFFSRREGDEMDIYWVDSGVALELGGAGEEPRGRTVLQQGRRGPLSSGACRRMGRGKEPEMARRITRRGVLTGGATLGAAMALGGRTLEGAATAPPAPGSAPFPYCMNSALLRGYELGIVEQVDLAGGAGYDGIEPWISDLERFVESGGSLLDLRRRIADHGLAVESAIGFAEWIVEDPDQRAAGLEVARRDMELVSRIGGARIAAPPAGAVRGARLDLDVVADRYHTLLEAGAEIGVVPQLEVWGFASNLSRLAESAYVVIQASHPDACLLPDVFHLYKGGSGLEGLWQLSPRAIQVLHMNDYPDIPRQEIQDKDRVLPGEGVAPLTRILTILRDNGCFPALSIELFNQGYWKQYDAPTLAARGLAAMKAVTATLDHASLPDSRRAASASSTI
jgi:2-keto-myo-inositol isomerase